MRTRPLQHLTNHELLARYADGGFDHPDHDAIAAEIMCRPSATCEDGTDADKLLTGFDQPYQGRLNADDHALRVVRRLRGVLDLQLERTR